MPTTPSLFTATAGRKLRGPCAGSSAARSSVTDIGFDHVFPRSDERDRRMSGRPARSSLNTAYRRSLKAGDPGSEASDGLQQPYGLFHGMYQSLTVTAGPRRSPPSVETTTLRSAFGCPLVLFRTSREVFSRSSPNKEITVPSDSTTLFPMPST